MVVNLFNSLDAYPFSIMEEQLNKAPQSFFSKIVIRRDYHQVPLKVKDQQFTAIEVEGKLDQFSRLSFGLTNAVPAIQKLIDSFDEQNKLKKTFPYLDDGIIGGRSKEEHNKQVKVFFLANEK